jgi:hypothetical protein
MLQLARLDPESGLPDPRPVILAALAEAVCADLGPQILDKNIDFELHATNWLQRARPSRMAARADQESG